MITFHSEYALDYGSYTFGYVRYALIEESDRLGDLYQEGFLPYTGDPELKADIFYFARSVRVDLSSYESTSENRRVDRKLEPFGLEVTTRRKPPLSKLPGEYVAMAKDYGKERFKGGEMPPHRFDYVYSRRAATHLFDFRHEGELIGYVIAGVEEQMTHYWFSFFKTGWMDDVPLGKWMMWKIIDEAAKSGKKHAYLGTCYGPGALYKVRDFKGIEWFNGAFWSDDIEELKRRCRSESVLEQKDAFKLMKNPQAFLEEVIGNR